MVAFLQPSPGDDTRRADQAMQGRPRVAEVLVQFSDPIIADGVAYLAKACGSPTADGLWQGWIEFTPITGGRTIRSRRETTQPNRTDAVYWATGLTPVYLEGAMKRALQLQGQPRRSVEAAPVFDSPADAIHLRATTQVDAILDPFSVYRKGEGLLRQQLSAFSAWHLVNIIRSYRLSGLTLAQLNALSSAALIELIVTEVRASVLSESRT
jgi:hypothetical protein